jgi:hypothetical protein
MNDWVRAEQARQDQERDRRTQEIAAEANRQTWMYWNDPVSGFWALMRQQDEAHARQQEANQLNTADQGLPFVAEDPVEQAGGFDDQLAGQQPHDDRGSAQQLQSWNDGLRQTIPEPDRETPREAPGDIPGQGLLTPERATGQPERPLESDANRPRHEPGSEQLIQLINEALSTTNRDDREVRHDLQQHYEQGSEQQVQSMQEALVRTAHLEDDREDRPGRGANERERHDAEVTKQLDEQERRQQEITKELNQQAWSYWNDPISGFWALLRKQDEARILSEQASTPPPTSVDVAADTGELALPIAEVDIGVAVRAYEGSFADTPQLRDLWLRAVEESEGTYFDKVRSHFWHLVNNDPGDEAAFVRGVLKEARFEFMGGDRAPLLGLETGAHSKHRDAMARRLTIDHGDPKSKFPEQALSPANLRFMTHYDNAVRRDFFNREDKPFDREGYLRRVGLRPPTA